MARERFSDEGIRTLAQVYIYLLCGAEKSPAGKKLIAETLKGHYENPIKGEAENSRFHKPKNEFNGNYTLKGFEELLKNHRGLMGIQHTKGMYFGIPNIGGLLSIKHLTEVLFEKLKPLIQDQNAKIKIDFAELEKDIKAIKSARIYGQNVIDITDWKYPNEGGLGIRFVATNVVKALGLEEQSLLINNGSYQRFKTETQKQDEKIKQTPSRIVESVKAALSAVYGVYVWLRGNAKKEAAKKIGKEYHWKNEPSTKPLNEPAFEKPTKSNVIIVKTVNPVSPDIEEKEPGGPSK